MKGYILLALGCMLYACQPAAPSQSAAPAQSATKEETKSMDKQQAPKVMTEATLDLTKYGIANNPNNVLGGLKVGDTAPDISLEDHNGKLVTLSERLERGPVLLIFYRADWCPYCTKYLDKFQDQVKEIYDAGRAGVVAVSPQLQKHSKKLDMEHMYSFPILYDKHHKTMKDYKVFFHVTEEYNDKIVGFIGEKIEVRNGNSEPVMPVPATYLIGQDQKIKYVHYDPNYRERGDLEEVMKLINV